MALAVAAFAAFVRVAFLLEIRGQPTFGQHTMDAAYHHDWALSILHGQRFAAPFYRAPLYAYFLAGIYALFGSSAWPILLVQAALGALTCVVIFAIARRLAGDVAALAAGLLYALYWPAVYFTSLLLVENLAVLLYGAALYVLVREEEKRDRTWFLGGLLTGLGIICRPSLLAFVPVPVAQIAIAARRTAARRTLARAGIFLAAVAAPIAPVTAYNVLAGHDAVLIAWSDGINFHIGNNPKSDGASALAPELRADWWGGYYDAIRIADKAEGRKLAPSQVSAYWRDRGLRFIAREPAEAARLFVKKTAYLFSAVERPNNAPLEYFRSKSRVLHAAFGLGAIVPLALWGLWRSRGRWRRFFILYGFLFTYAAGIVLFFVNTRYRLPLVPVLTVFAGLGFQELLAVLRRRDVRSLAAAIVFCAVASVAIHTLGQASAGTHLRAQGHLMDGNAYLKHGKYAEAAREFEEAAEIDPQIPGAYANQAAAAIALSDTARALGLYEKELRVHPDDDGALFSIGRIRAAQGDTALAVACYRRALALDPSPPDAADIHYNLGNLLAAQGDGEGAIREYSLAIEAEPRDSQAMNNLGALYLRLGRTSEAERILRRCVALAPHYAGANLNLGALLAMRGKTEEARVYAARAVEDDPSSVPAHRLLALLSATANPATPDGGRR